MAKYLNPWFGPATTSPEYFTTLDGMKPVIYRGFKIYQRLNRSFEIVFNDVCIGQYAGMSGAEKQINRLYKYGAASWYLSEKAVTASGITFPLKEPL